MTVFVLQISDTTAAAKSNAGIRHNVKLRKKFLHSALLPAACSTLPALEGCG